MRDENPTTSRHRRTPGEVKTQYRCAEGRAQGCGLPGRNAIVSKWKGISKAVNSARHRGRHESSFKRQFYSAESEPSSPTDSVDLKMDENMLRVCKIYLKRSLFSDCKLVRLNPSYVEHIVDLIFDLGFLAKRGHFMRDILDLINLLDVPESMLKQLNMSRNHRLSIFRGLAFNCDLAHPEMPHQLLGCRVLLVRYFSPLEDEAGRDGYDTIASVARSVRSLGQLVERVVKAKVRLIVTENYVPCDVAALLARENICCLSKAGANVMSRLAFALNSQILHSLDAEVDLGPYVGTCDDFRLLRAGVTLATLAFGDYFRGFTILVSTRMIRSENLKRIKELIKISIVRLQGIVEELELIDNLDGTFIVDTTLFDEDFEHNTDICENFSDYLDMLLGNTSRSSVSTFSPRTNLNYFSCDIYYSKIVESEMTCSEYRKLTRLQCFQYYTKINQLCVEPTFETIPIGNYLEGLFFSDFIATITNALRINKCLVDETCSESFINHQLHFETAYSNIENMRLSLTFQIASEKYDHEGINIKTFCTTCNHSQMHLVQDLTFGRFLQLILFNRSYRSKCDHLLFYSNKFSVLADNYSITFSLSPVSIYTVLPEFNDPQYNCSRETIPFDLGWSTLPGARLGALSNRVAHVVNIPVCPRPSNRVFTNLYFARQTTFTRALGHFYEKVWGLVNENVRNLVSYDIERHLPCLCRLSRVHAVSEPTVSQWRRSIKNVAFDDFMQDFEKHSAYGIELNYRLHEKLRASFDTGCGLHVCPSCGLDAYTTIADVDLLNWFYIMVHVVNAFESKVVKLKAALDQFADECALIAWFAESVRRMEEDFMGVFLQCVALLIYARDFAPPDPMYQFTIASSFFLGFYNLVEELMHDYSTISHEDSVASFSLLEYDKTSVIVLHTFGPEPVNYRRVDFIQATSAPCTEADLEVLEDGWEDVDHYTVYTIDEFLAFSQYFAVLSGVQDLAAEVIKKSSYFRLVSRIRLKNLDPSTILSPRYEPVLQPTRDVANILANTLLSREYLDAFREVAPCLNYSPLRTEYLAFLQSQAPQYEQYAVAFESVPTQEVRGVSHNYSAIGPMKRSFASQVFGLSGFPEVGSPGCWSSEESGPAKIYDVGTPQVACLPNRVLEAVGHWEPSDQLRVRSKGQSKGNRGPQCQFSIPFWGLPLVYTNSKLLRYSTPEDSGSASLGVGTRTTPPHPSYLVLSHRFVENCSKLGLQTTLFVKHVVSRSRSSRIGTAFSRLDANTLVSLFALRDPQPPSHVGCRVPSGVAKSASSDEEEGVEAGHQGELEVYFGPYAITVYYAREFHDMRHRGCGDDLNFARSLCRSTRMPSIGKSGSPIFVTYDGRFTIKLINKHEMTLFLARGRDFFGYFGDNCTLMSLPYGLFKVTHLRTNTTINCFVMQNIDYFHDAVKISFDLKGVALKRYISISKDYVFSLSSASSWSSISSLGDQEPRRAGYSGDPGLLGPDYVLLDQNFRLYTKGCPIQLDYESMKLVNARLKSDLSFLSSINIVDYSLLLRVTPSQSVVTLGLIDFLRPYTWDKQIETVGKRLANIGQAPTIVSPNEYRTRFSMFIQKIFMHPYQTRERSCEPEASGAERRADASLAHRPVSQSPCRVCELVGSLYSNAHFTCLKYCMTLLAPEVAQYLHLLVRRDAARGLSAHACRGALGGGSCEGSGARDRHLQSLVRLIARVHKSPTISWADI